MLLAQGTALLMDCIPDAWAALWDAAPEAVTPTVWLAGLLRRLEALPRLGAAAASRGLLAAPLRLQSIFRPSTLLNAIRQFTSRKLRAESLRGGSSGGAVGVAAAPLDTLKLISSWSAGVLPASSTIFKVSGLLIQGAAIDPALLQGGHLAQQQQPLREVGADAPELQLVPDLFMAWVPPETPDPVPAASALAIPVYQGLDRARSVMEVLVPCPPAEKVKWVLAGVALFIESE